MFENGGIPGDLQEFQDCVVFILNPLENAEEKNDDPMWSSASPKDLDWFLTDE